MSMESQLDAATHALIEAADEREAEEAASRPDEPSLPLGEWIRKNLFSSAVNGFLTIVFLFVGLFTFRGILNFVFSENRVWDAVRVNMRSLFTFAYQSEQYVRIWFGLGIVLIMVGMTLGLMKTIGRGFSLKRIAIWFLTWGSVVVLGILLREPSSQKNDAGEVLRFEDAGPDSGFLETVAELPGLLWLGLIVVGLVIALGIDAGSNPDSNAAFLPAIPTIIAMLGLWITFNDKDGPRPIRESFADAMVDRGWWWLGGLFALGIGLAIWFGLGDQRRRNTFVPAIPLFLGGLGLFISTVWWYNWGHYGTNADGLVIEPGRTVADTTKTPWTVMWVLLVVGYLVGRAMSGTSRAGTARPILNLLWLLAPFTLFFVVFRDPALDYSHVWSTHLPMALAFIIGGGALLWVLTRPGIGEVGRLIAVAILLFAAFNWLAAFYGWYPMLQKARVSFLLLGLAGLAAPNFIGETKQRMRLVWAWVGLMAVLHYLITMINTTETVNAPGDGFAGGFMLTIFVALFTMIFSFPLGVILALARTSTLPIFRVLSTIYIEVVRGVPLITILFFFNVFIPIFLPEGMHIAGLAGVVVGFSLFSAAYLAENVRGGLQAIRRGQYEASDAVGLTTVQRTMFIVLPQALRVSIPPLVGMAIATFKETSLLAIIGLFDFLRVANNAIPGQTEFLGIKREGLLFVSVVYWVGSYAMSKYSQRLEKQLGVGER